MKQTEWQIKREEREQLEWQKEVIREEMREENKNKQRNENYVDCMGKHQ